MYGWLRDAEVIGGCDRRLPLTREGVEIDWVSGTRDLRAVLEETSALKKEEILGKLAAGELKVEEASNLLAELDQQRGRLSCKVSEKGGVSIYGLQRMP